MSATVTYPARVVIRARELRNAGWTLERVCDLIERETGKRPNRGTVLRWTDDKQAEKHIEWNRARHRKHSADGARQGGRLGQPSHHSAAFQEARARALVLTAGLRVTQAARAMSFDYPDAEWTEARVRGLVAGEGATA